MNRSTRLSLCGLGVLLFLTLPGGALPAQADELDAVIEEQEGQIEQEEQKKKDLQSDLEDIRQRLTSLKSTAADLNEYIEGLDEQLMTVEETIEEYRRRIREKEEEIRVTGQELAQAQAKEEKQYDAMKKRIQFIYESQDSLYLEMIFSSRSFSDLLNKAEYIEAISAYDKKLLDEYADNRQMIEDYKTQLETQQAQLEEEKSAVEAEEEKLQLLISDKQQEMERYESDISSKEQLAADYEADIAAQNEVIMALEKAVLEAKKRQAEANGTSITYDGGVFKWPAPSYTQVTSDYGSRMHPTLGVEKFHNGIDMAAPSGSPILAAYDGQVVAADYNGSMGNYVMIDHGGGLYTIYMHASALYVSQGEMVARGQNIGAVGATGRATGSHLHFSVRKDGAYVSPWNYLE